MLGIKQPNKTRASSPLALKNAFVRSLSTQQNEPVNVSVRLSHEYHDEGNHRFQPLYHHQPTIADMKGQQQSSISKGSTHQHPRQIQRKIVLQRSPSVQLVDLCFDVKITTPGRRPPSKPSSDNENSSIRMASMCQHPMDVDTATYRIARPQPPIEHPTTAKPDMMSKSHQLSETRVTERRSMFHKIKCSVCSIEVGADSIDHHYDSHTRMFQMKQTCLETKREETPQKQPKLQEVSNESVSASLIKKLPGRSWEAVNYSPVPRRPKSTNQYSSQVLSQPLTLDRQETRQITIHQQQNESKTPLLYAIPPARPINIAQMMPKRAASASRSSSKKLQLSKNLLKDIPSHDSNIPSQILEKSKILQQSAHSPPSPILQVLQDKLLHYNYDRQIPVRLKTGDSVVSSYSVNTRPKMPLNILAQSDFSLSN